MDDRSGQEKGVKKEVQMVTVWGKHWECQSEWLKVDLKDSWKE